MRVIFSLSLCVKLAQQLNNQTNSEKNLSRSKLCLELTSLQTTKSGEEKRKGSSNFQRELQTSVL